MALLDGGFDFLGARCAGFEQCHVVPTPSTVSGENPAGGEDLGRECEPGGETVGRIGNGAPTLPVAVTIEKIYLSGGRGADGSQVHGFAVTVGERPGK